MTLAGTTSEKALSITTPQGQDCRGGVCRGLWSGVGSGWGWPYHWGQQVRERAGRMEGHMWAHPPTYLLPGEDAEAPSLDSQSAWEKGADPLPVALLAHWLTWCFPIFNRHGEAGSRGGAVGPGGLHPLSLSAPPPHG